MTHTISAQVWWIITEADIDTLPQPKSRETQIMPTSPPLHAVIGVDVGTESVRAGVVAVNDGRYKCVCVDV